MNALVPEDRDLLKRVLDWARAHEDDLDDNAAKWYAAFTEWWDKYRPLSERQRAWLKAIADRLELEPTYLNLYSSGKVPRGEKLATEVPAVLRAPLPKRPPGGRA